MRIEGLTGLVPQEWFYRSKAVFLHSVQLKKQNKIVFENDSRLGEAVKKEERTIQSLQQTEELKQSILKKVFEGKFIQ